MPILSKNLFRKPKNTLEGYDHLLSIASPAVPDELCVSCPSCKYMAITDELIRNAYVCPKCGRHFRLAPRKRIQILTDEDSFQEKDAEFTSGNPLEFPGYEKKLAAHLENSGM